jgi:hypothetical protein
MDTNESVEPESTQNYSENNVNTAREFTNEDLTDAIKASLLDDTAETATEEAENSEETPEVESEGVEDTEVLSQSEEESAVTSEDEQEPESEQELPEQSDDEDRGLPRGVKKRIDKLIAKRREAEEEATKLRQEVERLSAEANKPPQTPVNPNNPFSNIEDPNALQKEIDKARQIRRWCEMNPEGGVVKDANGNEQEFTSDEVRKIKVRAMDALEEHIPAQIKYIENAQRVEQVVSKEYPWWKDKSSSERQIAEAFMKHFPEIRRFPDYKMVLGDYIRGVKSREASKKTGTQRLPSQPKSASAPVQGVAKKPARLTAPSDTDALASIIASRFI